MSTTHNAVAAVEAVAAMAWQSAVAEIVGPTEMADFLGAQPAPWQGTLDRLLQHYGRQAGLGVGWRIGRAFARQALPLVAEEAGFLSPDFRFLPWPRKMPEGLARLGALASRWFAVAVEIEVMPDKVLWRAALCPFGSAQSVCTPWMGFLQEALYGLSGGHKFAVRPAAAPRCVFQVPRRPLY